MTEVTMNIVSESDVPQYEEVAFEPTVEQREQKLRDYCNRLVSGVNGGVDSLSASQLIAILALQTQMVTDDSRYWFRREAS